jgi:hypothetical protein
MMARLPAFQLGLGMVAWSHAMAIGAALTEAAFCGSMVEAMAIQQRLAAATIGTGAKLAADTVAIAAAGLRPLHRRVNANAQRLTRESRRRG